MFRLRAKGNSMALYAGFLAIVGVPLLTLTGDVTRAWASYIKLTNATEAACNAYANTLDIEHFQKTEETRAGPKALSMAYQSFFGGAPSGASVFITSGAEESTKNPGKYFLVARCTGRYSFAGFFRPYSMTHFSMAQARFGTIENWP
jgi:hypothetical protein